MSTASINTISDYIDDLETIYESKADDEPELTLIHSADFALMKVDLAIIEKWEDIRERIFKIKPRITM